MSIGRFLPSKFIDGADGRVMWLCYAANFSQGHICDRFASRPAGSRYGMCLREFRLISEGEAAEPSPARRAVQRSGHAFKTRADP